MAVETPGGRWVTIRGTPVLIGPSGKIEKGPPALVGMSEGDADAVEGDSGRHPVRVYGTPSATSAARSRADDLDVILRSKLKERKIEQSRGVNAKGDVEFTGVGTEHGVKTESRQFAKLQGGGIFTHSHPTGSSFSAADLQVARKHELAEFRAVTSEGVFKLGPPPEGWGKVPTNLADEFGFVTGYTNENVARLAAKYGLYYEFVKAT